MTLEKRIAVMEAKATPRKPGDTTAWFLRLLREPKANEDLLNAASFLAFYEVLDQPAPDVLKRLDARFDGNIDNMESWPDSRCIFYVALFDLEGEDFEDEEGQCVLCWAARECVRAFEGAPLPTNARERVNRRRDLYQELIKPWLERACPDLRGRSTATVRHWMKAVKDLDDDDLLESLRSLAIRSQMAEVLAT